MHVYSCVFRLLRGLREVAIALVFPRADSLECQWRRQQCTKVIARLESSDDWQATPGSSVWNFQKDVWKSSRVEARGITG